MIISEDLEPPFATIEYSGRDRRRIERLFKACTIRSAVGAGASMVTWWTVGDEGALLSTKAYASEMTCMARSLDQPDGGGNSTICCSVAVPPGIDLTHSGCAVDAIVAEADGYVANRTGGKPPSRSYAGFCHYEYL